MITPHDKPLPWDTDFATLPWKTGAVAIYDERVLFRVGDVIHCIGIAPKFMLDLEPATQSDDEALD